MKHNVTPLDGENEPLAFAELMYRNCLLEKTLECYPTWLAPTSSDKQLGLFTFPIDGNETGTVYFSDSSSSSTRVRPGPVQCGCIRVVRKTVGRRGPGRPR